MAPFPVLSDFAADRWQYKPGQRPSIGDKGNGKVDEDRETDAQNNRADKSYAPDQRVNTGPIGKARADTKQLAALLVEAQSAAWRTIVAVSQIAHTRTPVVRNTVLGAAGTMAP